MRTVVIGDKEIVLDNTILEFGQANLNEFLTKIAGWHAYYAECHADATFIQGITESKHEEISSKKYKAWKQAKVTDGMAKASTESDPEVIEVYHLVLEAKRTTQLLNGFLRAIDKAFMAAQQYCYNRRKEMDKLDRDIMETDYSKTIEQVIQEDK